MPPIQGRVQQTKPGNLFLSIQHSANSSLSRQEQPMIYMHSKEGSRYENDMGIEACPHDVLEDIQTQTHPLTLQVVLAGRMSAPHISTALSTEYMDTESEFVPGNLSMIKLSNEAAYRDTPSPSLSSGVIWPSPFPSRDVSATSQQALDL